eukprot:810607-Amphidinium_carterae.1
MTLGVIGRYAGYVSSKCEHENFVLTFYMQAELKASAQDVAAIVVIQASMHSRPVALRQMTGHDHTMVGEQLPFGKLLSIGRDDVYNRRRGAHRHSLHRGCSF